jgi:DNA-binding MarR family transcriptional regulator
MFDHCLYFNTASLARLLEREWSAAFAPFEVSPSQGFLLRAVLNDPGRQQAELARLLTITKPTATRLLDGLQAKGLVERRDSDRDGREWEIHPTAKALRLKDELNRASGQVTARLKKLLGDDTFGTTVGHLREVRTALE